VITGTRGRESAQPNGPKLTSMSSAWEYLCTANAHDPETLTRHMNRLAADGWELLTVTFAIKGESGTHTLFWRRAYPAGSPAPAGQA
jgi:hypothetical protein